MLVLLIGVLMLGILLHKKKWIVLIYVSKVERSFVTMAGNICFMSLIRKNKSSGKNIMIFRTNSEMITGIIQILIKSLVNV